MPKHVNSVKTPVHETGAKRETYHHGSLREALIAASEAILEERGASAFSLREAARRAGVSPAAPAHHFGDSRGLLTAVAARGFERLTEQLKQASEGKSANRLKAIGAAYLQFARKNRALFGLMWMRDMLDQTDEDYLAAGRAAFNVLEKAATERDVPVATKPHVPDASTIASWALVHGLAKLTLEGALDRLPATALDRALALLPRLNGR